VASCGGSQDELILPIGASFGEDNVEIGMALVLGNSRKMPFVIDLRSAFSCSARGFPAPFPPIRIAPFIRALAVCVNPVIQKTMVFDGLRPLSS